MKKKKGAFWIPLLILSFGILYTLLYPEEEFKNEYLSSISNYVKSNLTQKSSNVSKEVLSDLEVTFLDVGQADSILIQTDGEYMLIDAGNNEDGEKIVAYLESQGISEFKYVVGTHPHEDHIGGMDDIIDAFSIENFYMPDAVTTSKTYENVLDSLEAKNYTIKVPEIGDTLYLSDEATLEVLYTGTDTSDLNDTSIVLMLSFGDIKILFMGDAGNDVEKQILNNDLKADVLKVGHHGSTYSTSDSFLKKVSPEYAVISVGENNKYYHPHEKTLTKLDRNNVKILRTDEEGTIILKSDGENINFEFANTDTNG